MKSNSFLNKSKILMKIWILFVGIWLVITIFQALLGYKCTGYSYWFTKTKSSVLESFIAFVCLVLYWMWTLTEIIKCCKLLQEYKEFIKSIEKTKEIKETLFQMKISLVVIIVGLAFFLLAGMMNILNLIWFFVMILMKYYYATRHKKLVNLIGYKGEKEKEEDVLEEGEK